MNFIYVLCHNRCEWEDIVIFLTEEDAINASIKYPHSRVELFTKNPIPYTGYVPTYNYYQNVLYIIGG